MIVALAMGEVAVRMLAPKRPLMVWQQFANIATRQNEIAADKLFTGDDELFWRLAPNIRRAEDHLPLSGLISNAQGLREDHGITVPKPEGEVRILFLGDSCTFGARLDYRDTYVEQVEAMLSSTLSDGQSIECINAGVPGYTLFQGWRFLESEGYGFQPDVVVLYFGWNELASWGNRGDSEHYEVMRAAQPPTGLRWSRVCQLVWQLAHSPASADGAAQAGVARPRLRRDEFAGLLARIAESTARNGVDLLLLVGTHRNNVSGRFPPGFRSPYQAALYEFGTSVRFGPDGDTGVVDTVPAVQALASQHPVSALFFDHVHPTALTNRRIAELVFERLQPWLGAHW